MNIRRIPILLAITSLALMAYPGHGEDINSLESLRRAVEDTIAAYPGAYEKGQEYLARIAQYEKATATNTGTPKPEEWAAFQREVLLANPLLAAMDKILIIKRNAQNPSLGLPANWQGNCSLPLAKYDNEIATFSLRACEKPLSRIYKPESTYFVGDVDLNFDGERLLFSMPGSQQRCQIWEIRADGTGLRQVTPGLENDVDNYDPCYLPDGRIIFDSTANFQGVPCVAGSDNVANLCIMQSDGTGIRQLCFDQDHDWCPVVMNNGRILYTRWEYTDTPHSNTRLLFHMNPDGTGQMEYYGSNSYWPTSVMYARPIPGHPSKVAAIVTGHHGVARMGELVILDPALGRREASGAVQRIPGYGKAVEPVIIDNLADNSWPKFLHPYPLNEKYLLVACKPNAESLWGIYLVDIFDNLLLLREEPGYALFEPIPLRATPLPPTIPDKTRPRDTEATIYLANVYTGPGLKGIPPGTVQSLRVFTYTFAYRKTGGLLGVIGMDGPWDIKRVLGTVPVEPDGSAFFTVPANTPIAVQPLDTKGRALQLMRSWFTAMPGETLSCVGCHEQQNSTPPAQATLAAQRGPSAITPWRGPVRGFSFAREVQPVLDRYCLSCHNGKTKDLPDLRGSENITDWKSDYPGNGGAMAGKFSRAYASLHRFVRRPGIESDYHLLAPMEFYAGTTELVQMLEKNHYETALDAESWDRLNTWIDLNTPFHGTWTEIVGAEALQKSVERRRDLMRQYANLALDYESTPATEINLVPPANAPADAGLTIDETRDPSSPTGKTEKPGAVRNVDLGEGLSLELAYVPPGALERDPNSDSPIPPVPIPQGFWMGRFEITNAQYARFDKTHDSGVESMHAYQFGIHGYPLNGPNQPVVRVSWNEAIAFCEWLSTRTGQRFTLPTETQWEYACRAGSKTAFSFGEIDADFSKYANLGDIRLREFARNTYVQVNLLPNPGPYDDWIPKDDRYDDGAMVSNDVGRYAPNAWGLYDMHGNVWEWTQSAYTNNDANPAAGGPKVVRGGSWYDRPKRATAEFRLGYAAYEPVFNVGFRVVCASE